MGQAAVTSEDDGPTRPWEEAQIGDQSPPYSYAVTAEKIADYCRTVGYESPIYVNEQAAKAMGFDGVFAPPAMVFTYAPPRMMELMKVEGCAAPTTNFASAELSFQGTIVRPGDQVVSVTSVSDKFEREGNQFITFVVTAHNQRGERVGEYTYTCVWERAKGKGPGQRETPRSPSSGSLGLH